MMRIYPRMRIAGVRRIFQDGRPKTSAAAHPFGRRLTHLWIDGTQLSRTGRELSALPKSEEAMPSIFWVILSVAILSPCFTLAENAINPQMSKGARFLFRLIIIATVLIVAFFALQK